MRGSRGTLNVDSREGYELYQSCLSNYTYDECAESWESLRLRRVKRGLDEDGFLETRYCREPILAIWTDRLVEVQMCLKELLKLQAGNQRHAERLEMRVRNLAVYQRELGEWHLGTQIV